MSTRYIDLATIRIEFDLDTWLSAFPSVYSFSNVSPIPWKVDSTFEYNSLPTLRSGAINHGGTTTITLTFNLAMAGSITFPYRIISEGNYDWLTVKIDNVQVVRVSGSYVWTTYTKQLETGQHVVTFTYSKDGSGSTGVDAAGIGCIDIYGVEPNYNKYYLVYDVDADKYYANVDGSLTERPITAIPTLQDFSMYGGAIPTVGMLDQMTRFRLLKCADTTDNPQAVSGLKYGIVGNAKPQLFECTQAASVTEQYQTGFKAVTLDIAKLSSTVLKVILSYNGNNWYKYDSATTTWTAVPFNTESALSLGMSLEELALVDASAFALLYTEGIPKSIHIAFVIQCTELDPWILSNINVEFTTTL